MSEINNLVNELNAVLTPKGFTAEAGKHAAGKHATGNRADFIRFIRPARNNAEFGKIIRTENGWNTNWIGPLAISRLVLPLINPDNVASQTSADCDSASDRRDRM